MFKKIFFLGIILVMTVSIFYGCEEKNLNRYHITQQSLTEISKTVF